MQPKNKINKISAQLEKLKTIFPGYYQISECTYYEKDKITSDGIDLYYFCEENGAAKTLDSLLEIFEELKKEGAKNPVFFCTPEEQEKAEADKNQTK